MFRHKLVLMVTQKGSFTPSSALLMRRIKRENLLCEASWRTKERPCWAFRIPFLSITEKSNTRIIQNQDHIIDYLKSVSKVQKQDSCRIKV